MVRSTHDAAVVHEDEAFRRADRGVGQRVLRIHTAVDLVGRRRGDIERSRWIPETRDCVASRRNGLRFQSGAIRCASYAELAGHNPAEVRLHVELVDQPQARVGEDDGELAAIATTASSPDLSGVSKWTFRVISSDSLNGVILARFASTIGGTSPELSQAAVLYENDSYGRGLADAFRRAFKGTIISFDPINENVEPEPFVSYLKMKQPGIVFVAGRENSALRILHEARRQGFQAVFIGGDGWQGIVSDTAASNGAYVGTSFNADDPSPQVQAFVRTFMAKYQTKPDAFAALAYDATRLLAQAISQKGKDRRAIRDYLTSLKPSSAFDGVTGPVYFNSMGDPIGMGFHVAQVVDGSLTSGGARVAVTPPPPAETGHP